MNKIHSAEAEAGDWESLIWKDYLSLSAEVIARSLWLDRHWIIKPS